MQAPHTTVFILLIYSMLISVCVGIGIITSVGVAVGSVIYGSYCYFKECCSEHHITANFDGLESSLNNHIYGQHLVKETVVNALRSHWDKDHRPQKALTLSFHGWPGGGKNYVTNFIVENLYKYGSKSGFVHYYIGRMHFPSNKNVERYQVDLQDWLKGNVSKCSKQLFIFDEVDKMPPKVLDILKPIIDYRDQVDGIDFRDTIFIFLSNTGAELINEHYLYLRHVQGVERDHIKLKDFERLITNGAFNEEGGFYRSDTIKSNLIDHYIPFLPMERCHVKRCIVDEFARRKVPRPAKEHIDEALEFIEWGPSNEQVFSTTGCKRISQKVGAIVSKYKLYVKPS